MSIFDSGITTHKKEKKDDLLYFLQLHVFFREKVYVQELLPKSSEVKSSEHAMICNTVLTLHRCLGNMIDIQG